MKDRPRVAVLIPAAGSGERMGGPRKQFRELGGTPIIHHTIGVFEAHPLVDTVVVAAPSDAVSDLADELRTAGISKMHRVVAGGETRQDSVGNALAVLPPTVEIVLVHDAVRPFVPADKIAAVVETVRDVGAAALAVPVTDTVREGRSGILGKTLDRSSLFRMQTPQGFRRDWFDEAHRAARAAGYQEPDDVALVQRVGYSVTIVEGSATNFKITSPAEWELARLLWETSRTEAS